MQTHRYTVLVRGPNDSERRGKSSHQRRISRLQHSERMRDRLLAWLEQQHLRSQVKDVGETTVFNTLFIDATEEVGRALAASPDVLAVSDSAPLRVELLE